MFDLAQVEIPKGNAPVFAFTTLNAGKARTRGFEVDSELALELVPGLTLRTSAAFNDAEYRDFVAPCWGGQTADYLASTIANPRTGALQLTPKY